MIDSRKRGRPAETAGAADGEKLTKRQRQKAMNATPYFTPKLPSAIQRLDTPIDRLTPHQRIDLIADLSESILEDPAAALTSSRTEVAPSKKNASIKGRRGGQDDDEHAAENENNKKEPQYHKTQSKMNKLLDLASLSKNGHDAHAARLGLLSLLAIFQDVLPGYRIRLPTEAEMNVRVSKEVKATWDYERKLLQSYQLYLQLLERTWEDGKFGRKWDTGGGNGKSHGAQGGGPPTTLAATAILALSALLKTSYNFNFRSNLLQIVVRQANNRGSSDEVRSSCCDALSTMFAKDAQGDASLEAVRLMARLVKQQSTGSKSVHPDLLSTWLSLPLRVHEDEAAAAKLAAAAKAKKAKKSQADRDTLDIEREMKEGEAAVDKLELAKNQADTLHAVTLTYFRILKLVAAMHEDENEKGNASANTAAAAELLPCALRGLAKFSHLINLDAVTDLLVVLKDLLKHAPNLPPDAAVHIILCAFKTLRGPGRDALPVDPKEYLIPLYNILPRLGSVVGDDGSTSRGFAAVGPDRTVDAAMQCLDHAFLQRRELSSARLAAFLKRLATSSLHCPAHSAAPLLARARQISARYSSTKVERMLENEEDVVAEGVFALEAEDPEHSNAHGTSLWELSLLRYSVHPRVAEQSAGMAEGRLLKLPGDAPGTIWTSMGRDVREAFIPQKAVWKKHPLDSKAQSSDDNVRGVEYFSKRKRRQRRSQNQIRFITPRRTGNWHMKPASYSML